MRGVGKAKLTRTVEPYKITLRVQHEMLYYEIVQGAARCGAFYMPRRFAEQDIDGVRMGLKWRIARRSKLIEPESKMTIELKYQFLEALIDITYAFIKKHKKALPKDPSPESLHRAASDKSRLFSVDPVILPTYDETEVNPLWMNM